MLSTDYSSLFLDNDLGNLKTCLRFPYHGLNAIIDFIHRYAYTVCVCLRFWYTMKGGNSTRHNRGYNKSTFRSVSGTPSSLIFWAFFYMVLSVCFVYKYLSLKVGVRREMHAHLTNFLLYIKLVSYLDIDKTCTPI